MHAPHWWTWAAAVACLWFLLQPHGVAVTIRLSAKQTVLHAAHSCVSAARVQRSEAPELERLVGVDITPAQVLGLAPSLRVSPKPAPKLLCHALCGDVQSKEVKADK